MSKIDTYISAATRDFGASGRCIRLKKSAHGRCSSSSSNIWRGGSTKRLPSRPPLAAQHRSEEAARIGAEANATGSAEKEVGK